MTISSTLRIPLLGLALIGALSITSTASAQGVSAANELPEFDVDRDADALRDEIRPRPKDVDVADTVMVFTNTTGARRQVRCVAYDRTGAPIGRTRTRIPGNGVRYILASDLSNGRDFVGHAVCNTAGLVIPSALLLGPEIENLNTRIERFEGATRLRFPVIATY